MYTFSELTLSNFPHTPLIPSPPRPSPPVHQERTSLLPYTYNNSHHVRMLSFLSLPPTTAAVSSFAPPLWSQWKCQKSVLSKANPYLCKTDQTGAVPLVKGCKQILVTPTEKGSGEKIPQSHLSSVLFSCWFFRLTESSWKQRGPGSPLMQSNKISASQDPDRGRR